MVYRGTIRNGQVVIEPYATLPEGASVRVEIENAGSAKEEQATEDARKLSAFWSSLRGMAGKAQNLPSDIAENHDHYLYGRPKK